MTGVREIRLILTTLDTRGEGKEGDPVRLLTQLWTPSGRLVAVYDPCANDSGQFQPQAFDGTEQS